MVSNEGVRGLFNSKPSQGDPSWIFNTCQRSKGEDNSKAIQSYKPMRCMAFRVRGKESGVSWTRIKQAKRGEVGK